MKKECFVEDREIVAQLVQPGLWLQAGQALRTLVVLVSSCAALPAITSPVALVPPKRTPNCALARLADSLACDVDIVWKPCKQRRHWGRAVEDRRTR